MGFFKRWTKQSLPNATSCRTLSHIADSHGGGKNNMGLRLEETQGTDDGCQKQTWKYLEQLFLPFLNDATQWLKGRGGEWFVASDCLAHKVTLNSIRLFFSASDCELFGRIW
jgi:hypothetical protein